MRIPIYKPQLPPYEEVEPDIREMYRSGMLYPSRYTRELEARLATELNAPHVQTVASCSLGLIILLSTLPPDTKVIIPAFTFSATLQAVEWNRLTPVAVDVDDDGQLDPRIAMDYLASVDTGKVSAILPVHMWGNACYPEKFEEISRNYGVKLFFDGAHCLGMRYKGEPISRYGDATVHSIAATKPVSAGEGGIFITGHETLSTAFADAAAHGMVGGLDTRVQGINGKIQEFNSILALHALNHFEATKQRRAHLMEKYRRGLENLPLRIWKLQEHVEPVYKDCTIFVENARIRQDLERYLNEKGIGTKRYFYPSVPEMGSFRGESHLWGGYRTAKLLSQTCLSLPLYPALTDEEQEYVIHTIRSFFGER